MPGNSSDSANKPLFWQVFSGDGHTYRPSRHFIGEFQNRSGPDTDAKRASCEEIAPSCGPTDTVKEETGTGTIHSSERVACQILLRTHRTIS